MAIFSVNGNMETGSTGTTPVRNFNDGGRDAGRFGEQGLTGSFHPGHMDSTGVANKRDVPSLWAWTISQKPSPSTQPPAGSTVNLGGQ